jgi:hypothetical protein
MIKKLLVLITLILMTFCSKLGAQSDTSTVWINLNGKVYLAIPKSDVHLIPKAAETLRYLHSVYIDEVYTSLYKDSVIAVYQEIAGVQSVNLEELKEMSKDKKAIDAAVLLEKDNKIDDEHIKGNKKLGVGVLIGLVIGFLIPVIL